MRKATRLIQFTGSTRRRYPLALWLCLSATSLLLASGRLAGQQQPQQQAQQPPQPKISVEVNVVTVLATVRDKHGQIVSNLGKDDFALEEDGRPQTISY